MLPIIFIFIWTNNENKQKCNTVRIVPISDRKIVETKSVLLQRQNRYYYRGKIDTTTEAKIDTTTEAKIDITTEAKSILLQSQKSILLQRQKSISPQRQNRYHERTYSSLFRS